jgi:NAD(P)-dependent dehydrogenase (short-subunit alcohol dehydrogenase family)
MPSALITGGTTGIGRATAQLLDQRGYRVAVTGQNPESIARAEQELSPDIQVIRADARSMADVDASVSTIREVFGSLDLLFLNAGIGKPGVVEDVDEATFDEHVEINFKGQYFTLQRALPLMVDGGSIVVMGGTGVSGGMPGGTVTAGTRGALLALVPSLALELAPRRIRVNAVSPGAISTPVWDKLGAPAEMREKMSARIPFERFGTAEEVAEAVAFLGSSAAGYVTGQELRVAGGADLANAW